MYYSISPYVPGMVSSLLREFQNGALHTNNGRVWPDKNSTFCLKIARASLPTLTIKVDPDCETLYLHDGVDDRNSTLSVENVEFTKLLRKVGTAIDNTRKYVLNYDPDIVARALGTVKNLFVLKDMPWDTLSEKSRKNLVCMKMAPQDKYKDYIAERAISTDDYLSLKYEEVAIDYVDPDEPDYIHTIHDKNRPLHIPDPQESLLFACQAASASCIEYLITAGGRVSKECYKELIKYSLSKSGASRSLSIMISSGGDLPDAEDVQVIAKTLGSRNFCDVYDSLVTRLTWGWA